jgi:hypothetical protein
LKPSEHPSNTDPEKLRQLVEEMTLTITMLSKDLVLKGYVNSVFDTFSVEDTIIELQGFNEWYKEQHPEAVPPEMERD